MNVEIGAEAALFPEKEFFLTVLLIKQGLNFRIYKKQNIRRHYHFHPNIMTSIPASRWHMKTIPVTTFTFN
jgi:hypothetical protein